MEQLKQKIIEVITQNPLAAVATVEDDKPWVRYMAVEHDQDLICYTTTFANSHKVAQIKKNNNVHITMGGDPQNWEAPYINIQAKAELLSDPESKQKCWKEILQQFFSGPDDPNYIVINFVPSTIEYHEPGLKEPLILKLA